VLIYKSAFAASGSPSELANKIEETFDNNGFPPQWRFGLYEYPHYHSTSHEILGVFRGSARVRYNSGSWDCMTCQDPSDDNMQDQLACAMHLAYEMFPCLCLLWIAVHACRGVPRHNNGTISNGNKPRMHRCYAGWVERKVLRRR